MVRLPEYVHNFTPFFTLVKKFLINSLCLFVGLSCCVTRRYRRRSSPKVHRSGSQIRGIHGSPKIFHNIIKSQSISWDI